MTEGGYSLAPRWPQTWSADDWIRMLAEMGVPHLRAAQWACVFADEVQPARFSQGLRDVVDFVPQILHESNMLGALRENLDYSAQRISEVWPRRFPTAASAEHLAHRPDALAEAVYGGRMGNESPGDAAKYPGRGLIMVTGLAGYRRAGEWAGQDFLDIPDLLEQPHFALDCACSWWENDVPDCFLSDQVKIRRRINGGEIGLEHCQELATLCARVLS